MVTWWTRREPEDSAQQEAARPDPASREKELVLQGRILYTDNQQHPGAGLLGNARKAG